MRNLGGLLAGASTAAMGFVDPGICSMSDGFGTGGSGAAGWLEDNAGGGGSGTGTGTGAGTGEGTGTGTGEGTGTGGELTVADWMKGFSGEKTGDELSHQEWLAKNGVKDPDDLVKRFRDTQRAFRDTGKVKIPGDGASEAEITAYREAIGVPKDAASYEIAMPEGAEKYELDTAILDPLKEAAHKLNVPQAAMQGLANVFLEAAIEDAKTEVARTDTEAQAQIKEWGTQAGQRKEEFRRAAQFLDLTAKDVQDIQREFGGGRTLALFSKIGALMGEDFFATGNAGARFGVANLEAAQKQLDGLINDRDFGAKLNAGDAGARAKYDNAVAAVATFKEAEKRKR